MLYNRATARSVEKVVIACKYTNMQDTILRPPQWCERHRWTQLCVPPPSYRSSVSTWRPARRPSRGKFSQADEPTVDNNKETKGMSVHADEFQAKVYVMHKWPMTVEPSQAATLWRGPEWWEGQSLYYMSPERGSHIPVTHDDFIVQVFADGHMDAQRRHQSHTSWKRWFFLQQHFRGHGWRTADM